MKTDTQRLLDALEKNRIEHHGPKGSEHTTPSPPDFKALTDAKRQEFHAFVREQIERVEEKSAQAKLATSQSEQVTPAKLQDQWKDSSTGQHPNESPSVGAFFKKIIGMFGSTGGKWALAGAASVLAFLLINDSGSVTDRRYEKWKDPTRGSEDSMPSECRLLKGGTLHLVDLEKRTQLTGKIQSADPPETGIDHPLTLAGKDAEGVIATFRGKVRFGQPNAVFNGDLELSGFFTNGVTNVVYLLKP